MLLTWLAAQHKMNIFVHFVLTTIKQQIQNQLLEPIELGYVITVFVVRSIS